METPEKRGTPVQGNEQQKKNELLEIQDKQIQKRYKIIETIYICLIMVEATLAVFWYFIPELEGLRFSIFLIAMCLVACIIYLDT